jgi:hypothetical protein
VVGDQRDARRVRRDVGHAAHEPGAAHDRLVVAHSLVGALVDRDGRVPHGRRAADHARGHGIVPVGEVGGLVEADQPPQLLRVTRGGLRHRQLPAQLLVLRLQVLVLGLGVEHVARPPHQVAGRLQRAAGALLEWRHHLEEAALDRMQPTGGGFAEVDRQ